MGKVLTALSVIIGAAVWLLLFVILGAGLGTAFIAGGGTVVAGALAAGMVSPTPFRSVLDAPLTSPGLLIGIATFVILEVVLSIPTWVGITAGLAATGVYSMIDAAVRPQRAEARSGVEAWKYPVPQRATTASGSNGHDRSAREPVGAR